MKKRKRLPLIFYSLIIISVISIFTSDYMVKNEVEGKLFDDVHSISFNKVGLLLGTAKILQNGKINLYYTYRINAAVELFNSGKIEYILVSGDNSTTNYDEPTTIKNDLIANGIPANKIFLDYAGFRTLDSVVRSKAIFGQTNITVISQKFHNERAVYIANNKGLKAIGFNAKDVSNRYGFKTQLREKFARVKMMLDLLIGKKPKFLGEKIEIK